jgi:hypothetical protein
MIIRAKSRHIMCQLGSASPQTLMRLASSGCTR